VKIIWFSIKYSGVLRVYQNIMVTNMLIIWFSEHFIEKHRTILAFKVLASVYHHDDMLRKKTFLTARRETVYLHIYTRRRQSVYDTNTVIGK